MRIDSYQFINTLEKSGSDAMKCRSALKCVFLEFDVEVPNCESSNARSWLEFNQNVVFLLMVVLCGPNAVYAMVLI